MIPERLLRGRKDEEDRVKEAERMEFRARERSEAVISKARAKEKALAEAEAGTKGRGDVREGGGIDIEKIGRRMPLRASPRKPRRRRLSSRTATSRKRSGGLKDCWRRRQWQRQLQ